MTQAQRRASRALFGMRHEASSSRATAGTHAFCEYDPSRETRKKSERVEVLAVLFADAAEGTLEDKKLTDRVNGWVPANLRETAVESE